MAITIIVEDGSIVENANSLNSRENLISFAETLGIDLPDDETTDVLLLKAMNFINAQEPYFKGQRVERDQPLPFPRTDLWVDGWYIAESEVPRQAEQAQIMLAIDVHNDIDLFNRPPRQGQVVKERIEGALEVAYENPRPGRKTSYRSGGMALLRTLMVNAGLFSVPVVRA